MKLTGRNILPVEVGDLVICTFMGTTEYEKVGLVLDRIHYVEEKKQRSHPDEYSCLVLFENGERMVRAKWLQVLSKNLEKEGICDNTSL